jgi:hypothetical protein
MFVVFAEFFSPTSNTDFLAAANAAWLPEATRASGRRLTTIVILVKADPIFRTLRLGSGGP